MRLTPHQKKQFKLTIILLFGIPAVVFAVYKGVQYLLLANSDPSPKEIIVSNVTTNSLTISWVTEKPVETFVIPVTAGVEGSPVPDKRGAGKRESHYVELKNLEPDMNYSFILLCDGERYTEGQGGPYIFSTAPVGMDTPIPNPVHGSVSDSSTENVIVYILFTNKSTYPVSALVPSSGNWIVDLSAFRSIEEKKITMSTDNTQLTLIAKKGLSKIAMLQGEYSELFSKDGKLLTVLSLNNQSQENFLSYFAPETILGTKQVIAEQPATDQSAPEPTPELLPEPELPSLRYPLRRDVEWRNLTAGSSETDLSSGEETVMITNLSDVTFSVVWISSSKEEGYIKYGVNETQLDKEGRDVRDSFTSKGSYKAHYIETDRLEPDTTYFFEVYSGGRKYDNNGQGYMVKTFSTLPSPPPFETRAGTITNVTDPSDWIIVFTLIDDDQLGSSGSSNYISSLPDSNGSWIVTIGDARTTDGSSYFSFSTADILQASFLGAVKKTFDFKLSENDLEMDVSSIGRVSQDGKVALLENYGIIKER